MDSLPADKKRDFTNSFAAAGGADQDEDDAQAETATATSTAHKRVRLNDSSAAPVATEATTNTTTTAVDSNDIGTFEPQAVSTELNRNKPRPKHNQKLNSHNTNRNNTNQHKPISQCGAEADALVEQCVIDLWDKQFRKDTQPLVSSDVTGGVLMLHHCMMYGTMYGANLMDYLVPFCCYFSCCENANS